MPPDTDPPEDLLARLQKARKRMDGAVPASPEWAAAEEASEALEQQLRALRPTSASGPDTLARLGPMLLADGCLIHASSRHLAPTPQHSASPSPPCPTAWSREGSS
ncbi:MAG: hypothetical protein ACLQBX_04345 [Candidatus Limnocylindrales bacterium]